MRSKVLLYHLDSDTETGRALRGVLLAQKLFTVTVGEAQAGERVARLVSTNAAVHDAPAPEPPPQESFMLLCGLGERQLDRLLAAMRRAGVSVPYKAVLTEHNRDWTLCDLMQEVVREHELMKQQMQRQP
ncbi:MAG: DUF3783 domain-containing protein [Oscillospiraceae bacterium]|nr:DUF3783 domain-containing protein [Oscillospiraceae bacterium]